MVAVGMADEIGLGCDGRLMEGQYIDKTTVY